MYIEDRGQLTGVYSLFPPCWTQELNSGGERLAGKSLYPLSQPSHCHDNYRVLNHLHFSKLAKISIKYIYINKTNSRYVLSGILQDYLEISSWNFKHVQKSQSVVTKVSTLQKQMKMLCENQFIWLWVYTNQWNCMFEYNTYVHLKIKINRWCNTYI